MAELCLECFNKYCNKTLTEKDVVMVETLCEGCAEYKPCVIRLRDVPRATLKQKLFLFLLRRR